MSPRPAGRKVSDASVKGATTFAWTPEDRVCVAVTDRDCLAGEDLELPPLPVDRRRFHLRPSRQHGHRKAARRFRWRADHARLARPIAPDGKVISPARLATVDDTGRFILRAAPGENFPYFVNIRGDRMAWDTLSSRRWSSKRERRPPTTCSSRPRFRPPRSWRRPGNSSSRCRSRRPSGRPGSFSNSASSIIRSTRRSCGAR